MENQNVSVAVTTVKKKSNAAWICGLIGFITSIPNTFCALLCAGAAAGLAAAAGDESSADTAAGLFWLVVLVSIACFALSFMGKGPKSQITGGIMAAGGAFILIMTFIGMGSFLFGMATGGLYIAGGIVSILNQKRPM